MNSALLDLNEVIEICLCVLRGDCGLTACQQVLKNEVRFDVYLGGGYA